MQEIRHWIISVFVAALICSVIKNLVGEKGVNGKIISLICSTFLTITVINPWVNIKIPTLNVLTSGINADAENISKEGREVAERELKSIIKATTESYVLEKASSMNATIQVDVMLSEDNAIPKSVSISGDISPYTQITLSNYITDTLGIPEAQQKWNTGS